MQDKRIAMITGLIRDSEFKSQSNSSRADLLCWSGGENFERG